MIWDLVHSAAGNQPGQMPSGYPKPSVVVGLRPREALDCGLRTTENWRHPRWGVGSLQGGLEQCG